jgi:type II secretion system protein D
LILALIKNLDVPPAYLSEINVFKLKKADATATATLLQQIFLGTSTTGARAGLPGAPALPGALPGATGAGATSQLRPSIMSMPGILPEGAGLIDVRISVDTRTNSIIVGGSRSDLDIIGVLVAKLDDTKIAERRNEVYHLHNAAAADVASSLQTYYSNVINVMSLSSLLTPFEELTKQVIIVPEPVSNRLLISATPEEYEQVMRLITEIDSEPPQVVIQVLIAEVDLSNTQDFGIELGLQSPVLFTRSVFPATGFTGSTSFAAVSTGQQAAATITGLNNPLGIPGFNFNQTTSLGNNPVVGPGIVGFQGLSNLGVGRSNSNGIGGFVFSAASDSFNLLIRALKTQGRIEILSRPQITTLDNQSATMLVGQRYPYIAQTNVTTGIITNTINYQNVGVQLTVTPRISPEGKVLMRVTPEVSSVATTPVVLSTGTNGQPAQTAAAFNTQTVDTTVSAQDGETVVLGGLIVKNDNKTQNSIPWLGDLPIVGSLWRFRSDTKTKTELLVIMTPHVVRSRLDSERILCDEARKMDWTGVDVVKIHGGTGLECVLPPAPAMGPGGCVPSAMPVAPMNPLPPLPGNPLPAPNPPPNAVPPAAKAPASVNPLPPAPPANGGAAPVQQAAGTGAPAAPFPVTNVIVPPPAPEQGKESSRWDFLKRFTK